MTALAASNHRVRRLRRLSGRRSARYTESAFLIEGPVAVAEAINQGTTIEAVYVEEQAATSPELAALIADARHRSVPVLTVADGVIDGITDSVTPRPVLAVVSLPQHDTATVIARSVTDSTPVIVLIDVRDPGNVGTIIRAADASGAAGVICCTGTADPYSPKVVRAAAGSVLHVPVVVGVDPDPLLDQLEAAGVPPMATVVEAGVPYDTAPLFRPHALLLGNEATGLDADLLRRANLALTIHMEGRAESLNVAMASAVLCFEAARQRRAATNAGATSETTNESDWTPLPADDKVNTP